MLSRVGRPVQTFDGDYSAAAARRGTRFRRPNRPFNTKKSYEVQNFGGAEDAQNVSGAHTRLKPGEGTRLKQVG